MAKPAQLRLPEDVSEADQARFWSKVALPNEQGCMLWMDRPNGKGYGRFKLANQLYYAHRVSYTLAYGPIPEGLQVDHVKARGCTNRHCMAPLHLEAVTQAENKRRGQGGVTTGAQQRAKTHCPQGHAYDEENTRITTDARRQCRTCRRAHGRKYRERRAG